MKLTVVTIREYTRNVYKYMREGEYVVTVNGVETFRIVVTGLIQPVRSKDTIVQSNYENSLRGVEDTEYVPFEESI